MISIAVTGASGFVGRALCSTLLAQGHAVRAAVRSVASMPSVDGLDVVSVGEQTDWSAALDGVDCVIHCAARAHVMNETVADSLAAYRSVNVAGTQRLAEQAAALGVRRLVFLSSIKVNGEQTPLGQPFTADDTAAPEDAYGISKWEAEQGLKKIAAETGMEVVIIRPPLVYGPNVKGNFASMIKLVERGFPLPLGSIHNQRSLVALDNLVDLIITCIAHPAAANQVFLAGDGQDLSTTELLRGVAKALGKRSRLIPIPSFLLMLAATVLGKKAVTQRLLGSLQVDISKTRDLLGWVSPISIEEGLRRCFSKD